MESCWRDAARIVPQSATAAGMAETLAALASYLRTAGQLRWSARIAAFQCRLLSGDREDVQSAVREILSLYTAGMGGFQDLVLQDRSGVLPEQQAFGELQSRLFREAWSLLS
jgi:hypothetical protein